MIKKQAQFFNISLAAMVVIGTFVSTSRAEIASREYVDTNIETVMGPIGTLQNDVKSIQDDLGDTATLSTTDKATVVGAINEVNAAIKNMPADKVGDLDALNTSDKTSAVGAINSVVAGMESLDASINNPETGLKKQVQENTAIITELNSTAEGSLKYNVSNNTDQLNVLVKSNETVTELATKNEKSIEAINTEIDDLQASIQQVDNSAVKGFTDSGSGYVVTGVSGRGTVTRGNIKIPVGSADSTTSYATIWVE